MVSDSLPSFITYLFLPISSYLNSLPTFSYLRFLTYSFLPTVLLPIPIPIQVPIRTHMHTLVKVKNQAKATVTVKAPTQVQNNTLTKAKINSKGGVV